MKILRARRWRHIGTVPWCIPLGAHDIGEAVLDDGRIVTTTWGASILLLETPDNQWTGEFARGLPGFFEYILPSGDPKTAQILSVLDPLVGDWADV